MAGVEKTVWSLDTLKELLDERDRRYMQRFDGQDAAVTTALAAAKEAVTMAMAAAEKAVTKAETATEKRLEGVNEFRKSLEDQQVTFVRQDVFDARFKSLDDRITAIATLESETRGRGAGRNDIWIILVVVATLAISVTAIFLK